MSSSTATDKPMVEYKASWILFTILTILYCCTKYLNTISKLCSKECYNFPIIEVDKIEAGDNADILEKNYGGYIGVKYY